MERFYSWRHLKHCPLHGTIEALVLCYKSCQLTEGNVYADVETALKSDANLPDCVYMVGSTEQYKTFKAAWDPTNTHLQTMIKRGMKAGFDFVKQYIFVEWDGANFHHHPLGESGPYDVDLKLLMSRGVNSLIEKNNAIHQAPSGQVFKHPSQRRNKVFIQAREIAFRRGRAVRRRIPHSAMPRAGPARQHHGLHRYHGYLCIRQVRSGPVPIPRQRSSASTPMMRLEKINPPSDPYFCIVSASTSGSMAKKMASSVWDPQRIATIVDVTSQGRAGDVMVALDKMGVAFPDLKVSDGTLIEIIGENFSSKAKPPRTGRARTASYSGSPS